MRGFGGAGTQRRLREDGVTGRRTTSGVGASRSQMSRGGDMVWTSKVRAARQEETAQGGETTKVFLR